MRESTRSWLAAISFVSIAAGIGGLIVSGTELTGVYDFDLDKDETFDIIVLSFAALFAGIAGAYAVTGARAP